MTHLEVLTRGGKSYVKDLRYESTQDACDVALYLVRHGYSVTIKIDEPVVIPPTALTKI